MNFMGTKRSKDQILAQILKCCELEARSKTQVVYSSGLNFKTIVPYLKTLSKSGLIEIIPGEYPVYRITKKGEEALIHLRALDDLLNITVLDDRSEACEEAIQISYADLQITIAASFARPAKRRRKRNLSCPGASPDR
jgi:predicted transcriptional regulator